jgi:uncharacterized protein
VSETVLITGASSGIGMECAGIFARQGYNLVLVARDSMRLQAVAEALMNAYGKNITVLPLDLSEPGAPEVLAETLRAEGIAIDILVNNAGIGQYGSLVDASTQTLRALMRTNVVAPTMLMRHIGAGMAERGKGKILNVASLAGFLPGPGMGAYYASKAYLLSLSEAAHHELKSQGVQVTTLCPGMTTSQFHVRAGKPRKGSMASAQSVAWAGYRGLMRGKRLVVPGIRNKLTVVALRLTPRSWALKIAARINK